jgi:extracellular elastinolytic metalloproteinase
MLKNTLLFCSLIPSLLLAQAQFSQKQVVTMILSQNTGLTIEDLAEIRITAQSKDRLNGVSHIYINQFYKNIPIHNAIIGLHISKDEKILGLSNQFVKNLNKQNVFSKPALSAYDATILALNIKSAHSDKIKRDLKLSPISNTEQSSIFRQEDLADGDIKCQLKWVNNQGNLLLVWNVNWRTLDGRDWWNQRINAITGVFVEENNWIADGHSFHKKTESNLVTNPNLPGQGDGSGQGKSTAKYHVLNRPIESPSHGDMTLINDPSDSLSSPYSWHDVNGAIGHEYTITRGNNVYASEDKNNRNTAGYSPDGGASLNFDFAFDKTKKHTDYLDAAITNLFYWNNLMHDVWYHYGFDDESGNFQVNNYGRGGEGSDEVLADAQDGSGTNNANFATPPDGQNPRMQMYVWNVSATSYQLRVIQPTAIAKKYLSVAAGFGPKLTKTPISGNLVLANDATATPTLGCGNWSNANDLSGQIALIDRGDCRFIEKVKFAQNHGAKAAIVIQNTTEAPFTMGGDGTTTITIPAIMISKANGDILKNALKSSAVSVILYDSTADAGKQYDSDFDNGIISHEYGHGISNRLTGGPANTDCLTNQEQMGEGWSDFFSLVMTHKPTDAGTDKRGIGTYAIDQANDGNGIRNYPYSTSMAINPVTYKNIKTFSIPHGVGSVWCSMLWDMYWDLIARYGYDKDIYNGKGGNNLAMKLVIDGLKLQPCNPGFEDGRDAILLADQINNNGANQDLIWKAFARRGLGFGASQGSNNSVQDGVESFNVPKFDLPEIVKTSLEEVKNSDTLMYKIVLTNRTTKTIGKLSFSDTLKPGLKYIKSTGFDKGSIMGSIYSAQIDSIRSGDSLIGKIYTLVNAASYSNQIELSDFEMGENGWKDTTITGLGGWRLSGVKKYKGNQCYYISNLATKSDNAIIKTFDLTLRNPHLVFYHFYNTEADWDGGIIELKRESAWLDLGNKIIENAYNGKISVNPESAIGGRNAFTGNSKGFIRTTVDLSTYKNDTVQIRFRMVSDGAQGAEGWYIDNISLYEDFTTISNSAQINNLTGSFARSEVSTLILKGSQASIQAPKMSAFEVVPNPFYEQITIKGLNKKYNYALFDVLGKKLLSANDVNNIQILETSSLKSGTYFLRIETMDGIEVIKLIK